MQTMRCRMMLATLVLAVAVAIYVAGCGGSGTTFDSGGVNAAAAESATALTDAAVVAPDATSAAPDATAAAADATATAAVTPLVGPPVLTVALNATLNDGGTVKATTITSGRLYRGTTSVTATITAGKAVFALTGLVRGFYNIVLNGLTANVIPCKIDSVTANMSQLVSTTLCDSVIGTLTNKRYVIKMFPLNQGGHPVVKYTDGTSATPTQYAYVIMYMKAVPVKAEVHRLAANTLLSTYTQGHHTMSTWLMGPTSHGSGSTASCTGCHGNLSSKPASYSSISASNGWCYRCHYGPTGATAGMVHPLQ